MALLETLPESVENSLRALRHAEETSGNGQSHAPLAPEPSADPLLDSRIQEGNGSDSLAANGNGNGHAPARAEFRPLTFETDMNANGTWGEEWLVLDERKVYVFSPNGGDRAHLRHAVPLPSIQEAKAEVHIGNGLLEVRTESETISLVRFSQAVVGEANLIARQINALAKGEEPPEEKVESDRKRCPKCGRVLQKHTDVCPACIDKRAVLLRLFRFLAPYKWQSFASVAILLGVTAVELVPPYIGGRIVDTLTYPERFNPGRSMQPILWLVGLLLASHLVRSVLIYGQRRLNPWLGGRVLMDIRVHLYNKFNQLSLGYYDKRSIGSVMSRVTGDADNLWDFLADGIPWLISNVLTFVGIGLVLWRMNAHLALLVLAPGPLIFALTRWFVPRARRKYHHVWHRISKMYSALNSTLTGMRVVKAFAQEGRESERFRERNENVFQASYAANALWAMYWPLMGLAMALGTYIIWLGGGSLVMQDAMTIGTLTAFSGYLMQFYAPFQNFSRVLDWSTRSLTAAERVFEVLDTEPEIQEAEEPVALPEMRGEVEFTNVGFTYDKAKRVLDQFTLHVAPGEMIGLVGHSGAGKSTIINLLSRFYDVTEGSIAIDGVDIRRIQKSDFRRQFGIVLQEPFLFPGTIRDNIAYANPDATVEEIMRAAKAANCHEFIMKFPDGYNTLCGDRGQRLSGGERQRISIARAILHNPKILILDEATASVDTETEKQIQEAIARLTEGRTTFAIAHRLSTLRNADRLVVMKEGKMIECGSHDELMAEDGEYAKLVNIQMEVNKIRAL